MDRISGPGFRISGFGSEILSELDRVERRHARAALRHRAPRVERRLLVLFHHLGHVRRRVLD